MPTEEQLTGLVAGMVDKLSELVKAAPDHVKRRVESPWAQYWDFATNSPGGREKLDLPILLEILRSIRVSFEEGDAKAMVDENKLKVKSKGNGKGKSNGMPMAKEPRSAVKSRSMSPGQKQQEPRSAVKSLEWMIKAVKEETDPFPELSVERSLSGLREANRQGGRLLDEGDKCKRVRDHSAANVAFEESARWATKLLWVEGTGEISGVDDGKRGAWHTNRAFAFFELEL